MPRTGNAVRRQPASRLLRQGLRVRSRRNPDNLQYGDSDGTLSAHRSRNLDCNRNDSPYQCLCDRPYTNQSVLASIPNQPGKGVGFWSHEIESAGARRRLLGQEFGRAEQQMANLVAVLRTSEVSKAALDVVVNPTR